MPLHNLRTDRLPPSVHIRRPSVRFLLFLSLSHTHSFTFKTSHRMAYDRNSKPVQFLPNWPNAHVPRTPAESTTTPSVHEESLDHVTLNELRQGELYILKIKLIVVALFQGWDDDMCCFSVLRMFFLLALKGVYLI